jgi:hypothetical protein
MPCLCNAVIIHSLLMQQDNNSPRSPFVCAALYRQIQPRQIITYCQQRLRTLRTVRAWRNLTTAEVRDMDMNGVTREELNARIGTIESRMDARFAEADAREQVRFAEADAREQVLFAEADAREQVRFAEADARERVRFAEADGRELSRFAEANAKLERKITELIKWMVGTAIAVTAVGATILGLFLSNMALKVPQAAMPVVINLAAPAQPFSNPMLISPVRASPAMPRARSGYWSAQTAPPRSASLPS